MLISRAVPDAAAVERGQKIFVGNCGFCHGTTAQGGDSGPDLVRSALALDDERGDKIGPVIEQGRPGKGMPAFHLPADQIQDIAAFLRSRQQAAIDRNAYSILNVVTGDREKGREYFNGAGRCHTCHSPTGDLAGIAKKYDAVTLQSRFLYPRPRPSDTAAHSLRKSPSRWRPDSPSPARWNIWTTSMSRCATLPAIIIPSRATHISKWKSTTRWRRTPSCSRNIPTPTCTICSLTW